MKLTLQYIEALFLNPRQLLTAWFFTPFTLFFNEYIFQDWHFFVNLTILVAVDTLLGFFSAYKTKQVSSSGLAKVFSKILVYCMILIATHTAVNIKASGESLSVLSWIDSMVYTVIVIRELLSIFEKTAILGFFRLPTWLLERLKYFDENGKLITPESPENTTAKVSFPLHEKTIENTHDLTPNQ